LRTRRDPLSELVPYVRNLKTPSGDCGAGRVGLDGVALAVVIGLACRSDLDMGHEIAECREPERRP